MCYDEPEKLLDFADICLWPLTFDRGSYFRIIWIRKLPVTRKYRPYFYAIL